MTDAHTGVQAAAKSIGVADSLAGTAEEDRPQSHAAYTTATSDNQASPRLILFHRHEPDTPAERIAGSG